jgi:hypothetical protein
MTTVFSGKGNHCRTSVATLLAMTAAFSGKGDHRRTSVTALLALSAVFSGKGDCHSTFVIASVAEAKLSLANQSRAYCAAPKIAR